MRRRRTRGRVNRPVLKLGDEAARDDEPGDGEEDVHAVEAAREWQTGVEDDDQQTANPRSPWMSAGRGVRGAPESVGIPGRPRAGLSQRALLATASVEFRGGHDRKGRYLGQVAFAGRYCWLSADRSCPINGFDRASNQALRRPWPARPDR